MTRSNVYKLIDGERSYQNKLGPDRTDGSKHTVGDYITMLTTYTHRAHEAWTNNSGVTQAMDVMRKIAGIAVRCMEEHGAPER